MNLTHAFAGSLIAGLVLSAGASVPIGDDCALMVVESTNDRVVLLDAFDGSVINTNYLDIAAAAASDGYTAGLTPIEALQVGNEIWVSDQVADRIWRFDTLSGAYNGSIGADTGELNNIRGMERFGNTVYVAMGSDSDIYGEGIITIDATTGAVTGQFNGRDGADTSYWDVYLYRNELLVSNSDTGNDGVERYSLFGNAYLGNLISSDGETGIDFPQQINERDNGNLLVGGFSPPSGVHEYLADGTFVGFAGGEGFGPRSGWELGNGEVIWTNGSRVGTDSEDILTDASFRFISKVNGIPTPATATLIGLGGLVMTRRRR